ncbi:MAG: polysaccharide biosynthesis C-terminal domain-containing protein [Saprospiraceae bacterium]|nr:polysaccharide biosynthesis C-terminal domain-containing protein [Saprospiraceae bacterium]
MNYGLPIMVGGLAYAVNENVDKLIIPRFIGEDANGIYAACYKLGVFMTLYITAFRMGAEPFFFNHAGTTDAKKKYSAIMTWFVIFGCLFYITCRRFCRYDSRIVHPSIILFERSYDCADHFACQSFSGIYNNLAIWYKLTDKTRFGMYISIAGALLTIVSLMVFVPWMGIMGGAAATLFTYFFMAMISWYFGHKHYPVPYESGKIALLIACTSLLSGVSFLWFRGDYFINSALICIYVMIIYYLEKTTIKTIFSRTKTG